MMQGMEERPRVRMFEIYLFKDQFRKQGFDGHVRFVAAADEREASHIVAYEWGHWWRTCGIREVDMHYWCDTHSSLPEGKSARDLSKQAYEKYTGEKL